MKKKIFVKYAFEEVVCTQHKDFKNIYLLNRFELENIPLFKYMPLNRFIDNVKNRECVFVSPRTWEDPFERMYLDVDFSSMNFKQPQIFCMCLTCKNLENEAAAWKMYSTNIHSKSVQVCFDTNKFFEKLNAYASLSGKRIYIGHAIYDYSSSEIKNLYKNEKTNGIFFPTNFSLEHFLSLMCLKRKSFSFENEIRIFLIDDNNSDFLLKIPYFEYTTELIKKIKISPLPPFSFNDSRISIHKKLEDLELENIKKEILENIPNVKIIQSRLYSCNEDNIKI